MLNKNFLCCIIVASASLLSGCGRNKTSITLAGSTAFQPFAEKLANQFMKTHPNVAINVQGGGSAVGIQSALSGAAQIGMADLVTLPDEAKSLSATIVARDGVAMVVNPANKITNLTTEQIRGIFNGTIRNWKVVGGPDATIVVVSREAGSGTRTSFEQIISGIELTKDAVIQDSNGTIRETVANDANAIGYLSHGLLNERIKALTVDGVVCSNETIARGSYRIARPIFLLVKGSPGKEVQGYIDYVLSDEGQHTLTSSGLMPAK